MEFAQYIDQTYSLFSALLESGSEDIAALASAAAAAQDAMQHMPVELQAKLTPYLDRQRSALLHLYEMATDNPEIDWKNEWRREFLHMTHEWLLLLPAS